jgi:hypothetical protein
MIVEGGVAFTAGMVAGSVALVGFGIDSFIELIAAVAAFWRLTADPTPGRRERVERITLRVAGVCLLALAAYVGASATRALLTHSALTRSTIGILLAAASVVVMPVLGGGRSDGSASASAATRSSPSPVRRTSAPISPARCLSDCCSMPCSPGGGPIRLRPSSWFRSLPTKAIRVCAAVLCVLMAAGFAPSM